MNTREIMAERQKAKDWFAKLSPSEVWELGDQLVLGNVDWEWWFNKKPSRAFLNELDYQRMLWEQVQS